MRITEIELEIKDIEWYGIDENCRITQFTSDGSKMVPDRKSFGALVDESTLRRFNMDYDDLIRKAIKKSEVLQLLRGEQEYEVIVSEFSPDIFPTDINAVLANCFYKHQGKIEGIGMIFKITLKQLLLGKARDVYIAVLYFDACIFQEEQNKATFILNREEIMSKIKSILNIKKGELQESIVFCNGMEKHNP